MYSSQCQKNALQKHTRSDALDGQHYQHPTVARMGMICPYMISLFYEGMNITKRATSLICQLVVCVCARHRSCIECMRNSTSKKHDIGICTRFTSWTPVWAMRECVCNDTYLLQCLADLSGTRQVQHVESLAVLLLLGERHSLNSAAWVCSHFHSTRPSGCSG